MDALTTSLSFWLALILAVGTLMFYLSGALWVRLSCDPDSNPLYAFNLASPSYGDREELFAVALVAAGTSLSTVFLFFLTAGDKYGWWIALCPFLFAIGNYFMFRVYRRVHELGYFDEDTELEEVGVAGLIPYLGQRLTGSSVVSLVLLVISVANLLAVLVLELTVGVEVFSYLVQGVSNAQPTQSTQFVVFAVSLGLLLGYVFVGGFAAVVASDLWQLKIICWAVGISLVSLFALTSTSSIDLKTVGISNFQPSATTVLSFVTGVGVANLLVPLSQESSWQRFRAFSSFQNFSVPRALTKSMAKSVLLWFGLILLSVGLRSVGTSTTQSVSSMSGVLEAFRMLNDWWFPFAVFPILTVAALSAMYSTADTCVSAILYLVDYACAERSEQSRERVFRGKLPTPHYWAMAGLFVFCLLVYAMVRHWFQPTILQLVFSVFSNLIVIAPTVILASQFRPLRRHETDPLRATAAIASLLLGSGTFWLVAGYAIVRGVEYEWLSEMAVVPGLIAASIPIVLFVLKSVLRPQIPQPTLH